VKANKIAALRKTDRNETKMKLAMLLSRCCAMLNIEKNMNSDQITFAAEHLVQEKWMYSLEDMQLCLDRGAAGMYGTIYNRLDLSVINEWIAKFEQERQAHVTAMKQQDQTNNNIYDIFAHPQMAEALQQVSDKLLIKEEPVREIKRSKASNLEQLIMDEYDELAMWGEDIAFRLYNNLPYQFTEYRKERIRELIEQQNEY
jgi:hypothetical protein